MSIGSVSPYQQMQNWRATQSAVNNAVFGNSSSGTTVDYSSAFTNVTANFYDTQATLAGVAALTRIQDQTDKVNAANSGSVAHTAPDNAKAIGQALLQKFGVYGNFSSGSSSSSSSGTYTPPTNPATGYSYVATSAANLSTLGAVNMFV